MDLSLHGPLVGIQVSNKILEVKEIPIIYDRTNYPFLR